MNRNFLKKTAIILGSTVVGIYVIFLLAPFVVSPMVNAYVPQVKDEIKKTTGFESTIEDFKLVTTPKFTVGVKVGKFALANGERSILNADDFQVKMSLLPLLAKKIKVDVVSLNNLDVKLLVNKDGSFVDFENFAQNNDEEVSKDNAEPFVLPFGLKLSNNLPDIRVGGYNVEFIDTSTQKSYVISGGKTDVTDFILDKSIKVSADGKVVLDGREQFKYNLKVHNKIMPDLDLNELVFNPQTEDKKDKKDEIKINVIDIFKGLYNYNITANLDGNMTIAKDTNNGYLNVGNVSVINLPPSDAKLKFRAHKIDIDSNIYTAKNEVSTINGTIKENNIDLNFKSGAEISNIVRIVNAIAMTFDIKDLETLKANGKIDADFNIKSNMKTVKSSGYLKIPAAKVYYGLYDVAINDINADIALNDNNINIKNVGFSVLNQPLKFYGTIKEDATANLHLVAQNLGLKGLIVACGQSALLKDNKVNSGMVSLSADVVGKLNNIKPTAKVILTNLDIKNVPANTVVKLPNTVVNIISDGKTFSGNAVSTNVLAINPAARVSVPKLSANIKDDVIEITQTPVKVEKINFNLSGKIKNYMTNKISLDFVTSGDIQSTLTGDMNIAKQTLNLNYSAQNSTIIIPMFDKSRLLFNGNIAITGSMVNPILSGTISVPVLNIPEVPVVMNDMLVKLSGPILKGNATVNKFTSGGIVADSITTDFSMKGENFYLTNLKGNAFDGKINGNIIYNMTNAKTSINFKGEGMNAEKAIAGAAGIKNALSGTLGFDTKMNLTVGDYNDMMRTLGGNLNFKITNGAFGTIGRLENFLGASNIANNTILKSTVSTLSNLGGIKNSAEFDYLSGDMTFSNGWADLKSIKSAGKTLAYFVTGKYNLLNGTTNVVILGRLDGSVVKLLGPVGDLSADKLFSAIPKFGALTSSIVNVMTTDPRGERISEIPTLTNGSEVYKDFKVIFNGGIESRSSIKSFKWLTKVDTSALEQKSVAETVKGLKESVNEDVSTTVKNVVDTVSNQKEIIKNSAQELKNLFKF